MTCSVSVAVASSPVFSPSQRMMTSLSCKTSPVFSTLPPPSDGSPSSTSLSGGSPFRSYRFHRGASALRSSTPPPPPVGPPSSPAPASSSSNSVLKRKRPGRIDIPVVEKLDFSGTKGSDGRREVEAESERYSVFCKRGRKRVEMEDRYKASLDLNGDPQLAFFGVFDGHGGARAAEFASEKMGEHILEEVMVRGGEDGNEVEEAIKTGYLKTDSEFLKEEGGGGSCCVTAFLRNGDLVVSNAGDCRAVLSISGAAEALTSDHRPSREDERDRIESLGGYVDCCRGLWRLQGTLAVSRSIGDSHLKQWVIPEPETRILKIKPEYDFLILASDGLWDKVSNQEAVDIARPLCIDSQNPSPLTACKKLAELSATRGSMDDTSVMIIQLRHFV